MIVEILLFLVGIALILGGANFLTDGASAIARSWGISPMVVGLTVVAFGTSAPEFVVSFMGALSGSSGIALGNVLGSNIANIFLILGVTAICRPLFVGRETLRYDIPITLVVSLILTAMVYLDQILFDVGVNAEISRVDGIILCGLFILFLSYTIVTALKSKSANLEQGEADVAKHKAWWISVLYILGGLGALVWGGDLFVSSSSEIARTLGMSEAVIGLTLVALGTSLPELATSVVAAFKGEADLAIGNVIGSNIFNILFVLGATSVISPIPVGGIGALDFFTMNLAVVLLFIFAYASRSRQIGRLPGVVMLLMYIAYTILLLQN